METSLTALFCNTCELTERVPRLIANALLGTEQLPLLRIRYRIMQENYDCDYAAWQSRFGHGMAPFNGYTDTTAVPIPITHPIFRAAFDAIGKGAIGLDLPTWFNIGQAPRIMLIAQDPLRSARWYGTCRDAVVSSPFGLHDAEHRSRGNGGRMVHVLVSHLIDSGYGIYLTDARKFFVYDHATSDRFAAQHMEHFSAILQQEIAAVSPALCVCLGRQAERPLSKMALDVEILGLPHLSGTARGAIVRRFPELKAIGTTADHIASCYMQTITSLINKHTH